MTSPIIGAIHGQMKFTIYALIDPRGRKFAYVGCTTRTLKRRLICHITQSRRKDANARVFRWIRALAKQNIRPRIIELEKTDDNTMGLAESKWMYYFNCIGMKVLNQQNTSYGRYSGAEGSALYDPEEDRRLSTLYPDCPVTRGAYKGQRNVTVVPFDGITPPPDWVLKQNGPIVYENAIRQ